MAYRPMGLERAIKAYFDPIDEERKRQRSEETWRRQAEYSADLQEKARLSAIERGVPMRNILADISSAAYQEAPERRPPTIEETLPAESAYSAMPRTEQEALETGMSLRERGIINTKAEQRADITRRIKGLGKTDVWTTAQLKLASEFTDPKVSHKILESGAIYSIIDGKIKQIRPPRKTSPFTDRYGNIKPATSNSIRRFVAGQFGGIINPATQEYTYDLTINSRMALQTVERAEMILQGGKITSIGRAVNEAMNQLRAASITGTWRKFESKRAVEAIWKGFGTKNKPINITKLGPSFQEYIPHGKWVKIDLVPGSDSWKRYTKERKGEDFILRKWDQRRRFR